MKRRDFLRLGATTAAGGLLTGSNADAAAWVTDANAAQQASSSQDLAQLFATPPNRYRPMVRWWWNGDRVIAEEVVRELDVLQKAGIGGVEINPIRFPSEADPGSTTPLEYLSDEWLLVLEAALRATKDRGMTCDMIVGSGWPYGGEFLSRADQTQMLALGTRNLVGPQSVRVSVTELLQDVSPRFVSPYKDPLKELFSVSLVPYEVEGVTDQRVDLHEHEGTLAVDVPEGRHVLYFLVKLTGFMAVINGAPGASGPVLNHYSAPAVERYLNRISDRLVAKVGPLGDHFRAFFTDSIELEGENWCDDMLAQFHRRRGYDLAPFLPFVLFKVGEMGNPVSTPYGAHLAPSFLSQVQAVRYDFETTKRELFQERFIDTFATWCTRNGVKSRMQAYGMDCDPIAASMTVDIPECETWLRTSRIEPFGTSDGTRGRDYTVVNKLVASGAHLAGKQIVSCEEMTNTDDPFHTTLNRLKSAGDQNLLTGVTHTVLHGFNYSPLSAPFPGWVRYGTYFSERNPWWPYFKRWTDYKARLYAVLQHAEMQADIAILRPNADLAAQFGFQRDPFPQVILPDYLYKLWEVVQQNGSGCDYLTESIIQQSRVQHGRLVFRSRSYRAIMLAQVETLHLATMRQLSAFAAAGGTVLFLGRLPHRGAGFLNQAERSAAISEVVAAMRASHPQRTSLLKVDQAHMVEWYRDLQQRYGLTPTVAISQPTDYISQIHYRTGDTDIFFFTHYGAQGRLTFEASFPNKGEHPWLWNAETGERFPVSPVGANNTVTISLGPSESRLIVFNTASASPGTPTVSLGAPAYGEEAQTVDGPWQVQLYGVDGSTRSLTLTGLRELDSRPQLRSFAGTITCSTSLRVSGPSLPSALHLGPINAVSELEVNGRPLGVRWYGDQTYALQGALHHGENKITLTIVTTLGNYLKTLTSNRTAQAWTKDTPDQPIGLSTVSLL